MSFSLIQKYYFDPTFGGAFRPGESNAFYPLDTVTGFYQTTTLSNMAPVSAIFQMSPQKGIHNDIRFDYDTRLQRWRSGSLSTSWTQGKIFLGGTYFKTRAVELGILTSNHVQGRIEYGDPNRGLSSGLAVSYNLRTSQWLNSSTSLSYAWDCCGLAAAFNQFDLGLRTESRFSFSFMLKGIGSFGNIRRPESLF
jgi:LPS-assembly protein